MAVAKRVVAELGRPETPDETAARKAAASHAYRSSQTFRNLIAALLVTVAVVAVAILVVPRGELAEPDPVDVPAIAAGVADAQDRVVVVPVVPDSWRANAAGVEGQTWQIAYAPGTGFVRVAQRFDADDTWVAATLDGRAPTGTREIDGIVWDEFDLRGDDIDYALATSAGTDAVLVYGSGADDDVRAVAAALGDDIRSIQGSAP
ncbi:DUF4245 family protein [Microbacterium sp.]|uniref:DUF4245 family protein n=1 Tax=Microbacterium sp. TaxID=51671 RepID=UPI003A890D44